MGDALNRLDQTDALVPAHPMEVEIATSSELNHCHNHKTSSDTERVVSWIGITKVLMMTVFPWWVKTGLLWFPCHGKDTWKRMERVR